MINYQITGHFQKIQKLITQGRGKAIQAANAYSLLTYWSVGAYLTEQLQEKVYGEKVVYQLADWLLEKEPNLKGFDRRSLYRMRVFYQKWIQADWSLLPEKFRDSPNFIGSIGESIDEKIVVSVTPQSFTLPNILSRLSWTHHVELLNGTNSPEELLFYFTLSVTERYSVRDLRRQIKSALFERQMLAKHTLILPEHPQKEELATIFRDRYLLEFVDLKEPFSEFDLQKALIKRMKEFLLELGRDFIFIDEEFPIKVGMNDYFIDLVFYHRELQCLVAFDLKIEPFKPEHLGKMNFYLEILDRDVKKPHENPSIGVILCKSKEDEVVEIAMSRQLSPAMVAAYETKFLDKNLLRQLLHQWSEEWQDNQEQKD